MGATMLTTSLIAGGCGDPNANNPNIINYTEGAVEGRPNYESETETFKIWAYGQTCTDHYYIASEPIYFLDEFGNKVSMQTLDRTQELVDCGFNIVFIDYSHSADALFLSDEEWENSQAKQTLDYCQQLGLKAFSHGSYLYSLGRTLEMKDDAGNLLKPTTRILPEKAQEFIDQQAVELRPRLVQNEKDALIAEEEETGAIRTEITESAINTEKEVIRQEILEIVTAEANENPDLTDPDAKATWIETETTSRYNAELAKEETATRLASAVDTAVTAEINERANEIVDESIDQRALEAYWKSSAEKYFRNMTEYGDYLANTVSHLASHPAWFGYTALDEPHYHEIPIVAEGIKAFKEGVERHHGITPYVMLNMLPPADSPGVKAAYCENGANMTVWDSYKEYMRVYKECLIDTNILDYYQYDDYPVLNTGTISTFLGSHQMTSEFCKENDVKSVIAMQSYGSDGSHRKNETEDVLWQAHIGAAFGKKEFSYYTYWPVLNTMDGMLEDRTYPLTRFGERTSVWYAIQEANFMLQYFGKYLMNFDFVTSTYVSKAPLPTGVSCLNGLQKHDNPEDPYYFGKAIIDENYLAFRGQGGGLLIVTELYDEENDQLGFYVVNATDPIVDSEAKISIKFPGFDNVQIVEDGTTVNLALVDNTLKFDLGTGRGAFIMPY